MNKKSIRTIFPFSWKSYMWFSLLLIQGSILSSVSQAAPFSVEYTIPAPRDPLFYRPATKEFDLLEVAFNRSNMPIAELIRGSSLHIKTILPPGISYAAISGESNDWQGPTIGSFPIMAAFDHDPGDFCPTGGIDCVKLADLTPTTAALNRILYGNGSPRHPVRSEESTVHFVLAHPSKASRNFNMASLRIIMLVADKELYEQWRSQTPATPNKPPQNSVPLVTQTTPENQNLAFSSVNGNRISITDADAAGDSQFTLNLEITHGTLNLGATEGLSFDVGDGQNDTEMAITGSLDNINSALNSLIFSPESDFNGNAILNIISNDQGNSGAGGALSSTTSLTIVIGDSGGTNNQAPINQTPNSIQNVSTGGVLIFSTVEGNALVASDANTSNTDFEIALTTNNGVLTLASSSGLNFSIGDGSNDANLVFRGSLSNINRAMDGLRFIPQQGFEGNASIQFTTNDLGSGLGNALSDSDLITIKVNASDVVAPPPVINSSAKFIDLTPFIIDAEGSFSTETKAKIAFSATLDTLAGQVIPVQRDSITLSSEHFVNLKMRVIPEISHKDIKIFGVIQWGNLEESDGNVTLTNVQWYQKNRLQHFGSLNGNSWGKWPAPTTLPLTGLEYYLNLSNINRSDTDAYTIQVSAGHLIPPSGLNSNNRIASLYLGYEATIRETDSSIPFDNDIFVDKIVQVFGAGITLSISDGEPLVIDELEISLNDNELKLLNNPRSSGVVGNCAIAVDSPNPNSASLLSISDNSLCIIQLTATAKVGDIILMNARGIADQNAQIGSEILSTTRITIVD